MLLQHALSTRAACWTAAPSRIGRRPTACSAPRARRWCASNWRARTARSTTRPQQRTAEAAPAGLCALPRRMVTRHLHDDALNLMHQRATPALMRLRRSTVEHPFAILKYRIFGHPRLLLRGLNGARTEIGLAVMAYNLKRMLNLLGAPRLVQALA